MRRNRINSKSRERENKLNADRMRKRYHADPEYRELLLKKHRERIKQKRNSDPEYRERYNKRARQRYKADAAVRKRKSEYERAYKIKQRAILDAYREKANQVKEENLNATP